jgi:hypothetical protein
MLLNFKIMKSILPIKIKYSLQKISNNSFEIQGQHSSNIPKNVLKPIKYYIATLKLNFVDSNDKF